MNRFARLRLITVLALAVAAALGVNAAGSTADPSAQASAAKTATVKVVDNKFKKSKVTIAKNGKVIWRWRGDGKHDVYFVSGSKKPKNCRTQRKGTCARRFRAKGRYSYLCTRHGSMAGKVTVK